MIIKFIEKIICLLILLFFLPILLILTMCFPLIPSCKKPKIFFGKWLGTQKTLIFKNNGKMEIYDHNNSKLYKNISNSVYPFWHTSEGELYICTGFGCYEKLKYSFKKDIMNLNTIYYTYGYKKEFNGEYIRKVI